MGLLAARRAADLRSAAVAGLAAANAHAADGGQVGERRYASSGLSPSELQERAKRQTGCGAFLADRSAGGDMLHF